MQVLTDLKSPVHGEGQALALRFARGSPSRGGLSPARLDRRDAAKTVSSKRYLFRSVRTYMSIENVRDALPRSARTLIRNRAHEWKRLRSLRTLAFLMSLGAIDMQVLTDLKSPSHRANSADNCQTHANLGHPENPENPGHPDSDKKTRARGGKQPPARKPYRRN